MMNMRIKPIVFAVTLCTIGPAILTAPVSAAAIQEELTFTQGKTITPREEEIISSAGVKVLRHIAQARLDIRNKDVDGVKQELDQADKLFDIIQTGLPTTKVKDRIWVAKKHLEYENTEEVLPDLIPIYSSLDELVDIMPTDVAKKHLDKVKSHLKAGDKEKAKQSLDAMAAALQYTEVDLPISSTRQLVAQARADLNREAMDEADNALKTAEDSVVYLSIADEQPLFTAKALLWQAVMDVDAGDIKLAKSDLQSAIEYLDIARQSDDKATRDAASQIIVRARELQSDLDSGADISSRVHHLWERTQAFADRSIEYMSAGWARYRSDSPLKSDLIEAKLHLTNARIDLFTGHETGMASEELLLAGRFLDKAAEVALQEKMQQNVQTQITSLQKDVSDLVSDPTAGQASSYDALQQQLRSMIRTL
jgi:tetratricopeptide (TPR) repeat protein